MHARLSALAAVLGPEARLHAVGGALRDRLLGRPEGDWDLATALPPGEVMARARAAGYKVLPTGLAHGTVTVMAEGCPLEITTFRGDGAYRDGRRPESVRLGVGLEEDLARRDFTINALALPVSALDAPDWRAKLVDPFGGQADLAAGRIRAVGDPLQRFAEDGLRPLRACRFAAQLGFDLHGPTRDAISRRLEVCRKVAVERVLTELTKLLTAPHPARGLAELAATGLLDLWLPELRPALGCIQNAAHAFDVWEHTLRVVAAVPADPALRWAALLHDAGKPGTRTVDRAGRVRFHGHEAASEAIAQALFTRLKASRTLRETTAALVRHHMTHPGPGWKDAACRRFLARLDADGLALEAWNALGRADAQAKGREVPRRLREQAEAFARLGTLRDLHSPLRIADLALGGKALRELARREPGPWLGVLQRHLLECVMDDPALNTPQRLAEQAARWLSAEPHPDESSGHSERIR